MHRTPSPMFRKQCSALNDWSLEMFALEVPATSLRASWISRRRVSLGVQSWTLLSEA